jgi:hypothetical protein
MSRMIISLVSDRNELMLHRTAFRHPLLQREAIAIRGSVAPNNCGNFRWSAGVKALTLLLTRQALLVESERLENRPSDTSASIEGEDNSPAASLDYALSKQPLWLRDMFGISAQGVLIAKLIFRRINPDRKRPGPVVIFIPCSSLKVAIEVNGRRLTQAKELQSCVNLFERELS